MSGAPTLDLGFGTLLTLGTINNGGNAVTLQGGGNINLNGGTLLLAPGSAGVHAVNGVNAAAFRAWVCRNPDCPGRKPSGEPVKFVWEDPLYFVKPDGSVGSEIVADRTAEIVRRGGTATPQCPACRKVRNLASETPEIQRKYLEYCVEYVLPETEKRLQELEAEHVRRVTWEREQRTKPK